MTAYIVKFSFLFLPLKSFDRQFSIKLLLRIKRAYWGWHRFQKQQSEGLIRILPIRYLVWHVN